MIRQMGEREKNNAQTEGSKKEEDFTPLTHTRLNHSTISSSHTSPYHYRPTPTPRIIFQNSQHAVIAFPGDFDAKRLFRNVHLVVQGRSSRSGEGLHMLMGHFISALGWVSQLHREMNRKKVQMRTYLSFKPVSGLFKTSASYVDGAGN